MIRLHTFKGAFGEPGASPVRGYEALFGYIERYRARFYGPLEAKFGEIS